MQRHISSQGYMSPLRDLGLILARSINDCQEYATDLEDENWKTNHSDSLTMANSSALSWKSFGSCERLPLKG
jgi:hypothetical protein